MSFNFSDILNNLLSTLKDTGQCCMYSFAGKQVFSFILSDHDWDKLCLQTHLVKLKVWYIINQTDKNSYSFFSYNFWSIFKPLCIDYCLTSDLCFSSVFALINLDNIVLISQMLFTLLCLFWSLKVCSEKHELLWSKSFLFFV